MDNTESEDFDLNRIMNCSHEKGFLMSSHELKSGEILHVPFGQLKKDYPCETAKHTKDMVTGRSRRDNHQKWALELLKQRNKSIRRMSSAYGSERAHRVITGRVKRSRIGESKPRNARFTSKAMRGKHGIKIPNSTKEALILDRINNDNKWCDAMQKELMALEKLNV